MVELFTAKRQRCKEAKKRDFPLLLCTFAVKIVISHFALILTNTLFAVDSQMTLLQEGQFHRRVRGEHRGIQEKISGLIGNPCGSGQRTRLAPVEQAGAFSSRVETKRVTTRNPVESISASLCVLRGSKELFAL
jgi:hypothetical protein